MFREGCSEGGRQRRTSERGCNTELEPVRVRAGTLKNGSKMADFRQHYKYLDIIKLTCQEIAPPARPD